jgi:hypothetical protein
MRGAALLLLLLLLATAACGGSPAPRTAPGAGLPPDSLAVLREAIARARPAFATQEEALAAGVYGLERVVGARSASVASWVVELAEYPTWEEAEAEAARHEGWAAPALLVIEVHGRSVRLAAAGWEERSAAESYRLRARERFPGARVRGRGSP